MKKNLMVDDAVLEYIIHFIKKIMINFKIYLIFKKGSYIYGLSAGISRRV